MSSYKRNRMRKTWSTRTLRLRTQDALRAIEPVFLGEPGEDYKEDTMKMRVSAAHAYSQLISKYQKLIETDEILERIEALEQKAIGE